MVDFKKLQGGLPGEQVEPKSLNEAAKYVDYRSLLSRGKAVWKQSHFVWFSTAGNNPVRRRIVCQTGKDAKHTAMRLHDELRKARSNDEYNTILIRLLNEIKDAWPSDPKIQHVHECANGAECVTDKATGKASCGFDWSQHELDDRGGCLCTVKVDSTDSTGEYVMVIHQDFKRGSTVYV